jgi:hypothetical protein
MAAGDAALMALVRAIVVGDTAAAMRLLAVSPALARARLRGGIPRARAGHAVCSVVKRFCAATIPRADIATHGYQFSHDLRSVGSGGDVECGVARI